MVPISITSPNMENPLSNQRKITFGMAIKNTNVNLEKTAKKSPSSFANTEQNKSPNQTKAAYQSFLSVPRLIRKLRP